MGDRCFDKSAALAYVSLLGIFAVLTVVLVVSTFFFHDSQEQTQAKIMDLIYRVFPVEVTVEQQDIPSIDAQYTFPLRSSEELDQYVAYRDEQDAAFEARDRVKQALRDQFSGLVTQIETLRDNALGIGALGIIGLIAVSMMLFTQIEKGFNEVFHIRRKRPLWTAITTYFTILILGPVCIGFSFAYSLRLGSAVSWLSPSLSALAVTCVIFALAYWLIPVTRVSVINALAGGIMAGLLWEAAKRGFILYIINVPSMRSFVLTLGVIPTFLIWLYTTWVILFFGLEFCYVLQHYKPLAGRLFAPETPLELNPRHLLIALHEMAARFDRGLPQTTDMDLMRATNLDEFSVHRLLDHCEERGWITASVKHSTYLLARPPEKIRLSDVLINPVTHVKSEPSPLRPSVLENFWQQYHSASEKVLPAETLHDLLDGETSTTPEMRRDVQAP